MEFEDDQIISIVVGMGRQTVIIMTKIINTKCCTSQEMPTL